MITGHDFVKLSDRLSRDDPDGEAVWRTSIGRAYYGAFHVALSLVKDDLRIVFPRGRDNRNDHDFVQKALNNSNDTDAIKAGSLLGNLHDLRKDADYDLKTSEHGEQQTAADGVELANRICGLLQKCYGRRAAIKAGIETWQRDVLKMIT
jgi:hypothetical protein